MRALERRPTTLERWPKGVYPGIGPVDPRARRRRRLLPEADPQGAPDYVETARDRVPVGAHAPTRCARPRSRSSAGRRRWARSRSIPGRFAATTSTIPTSCGSTSTPSPAPTSRTRSAWPARRANCWASSGTPASRRPRAAGASTSTSGSSRGGRSPTSATPRSRSDGSWSGASPARSRRAGGRRSAASGSSSTTTRTRATARSPRPTASAPSRARRCPRR